MRRRIALAAMLALLIVAVRAEPQSPSIAQSPSVGLDQSLIRVHSQCNHFSVLNVRREIGSADKCYRGNA